MSTQTVRLHRWDEIALEKVTEMLSRKIVTGEREMLAQIYLKRGCLVPMHSHESEQMTYILQGALKFLIGGEEITVREGEVLHIPSWVEHQAEALEDTLRARRVQPDPPGLAGSHRRLLSSLGRAPCMLGILFAIVIALVLWADRRATTGSSACAIRWRTAGGRSTCSSSGATI